MTTNVIRLGSKVCLVFDSGLIVPSRNQHSGDQPKNNDCCNDYASEGSAEKVDFAEKKPSSEQCEADCEKKKRIEQNFSVSYRQLAID